MNEEEIQELIAGIAEGVIKACNLAAREIPQADPANLAARVSSTVLIAVADDGDHDSALITVRRAKDGGWMNHIHMDFLDADREHLEQDFHEPAADDNRSEYHD